ncbi:MAG: methylenetetrahydrofolate reductase [NAD(P)H] [Pseudopedobacter saltans]|uniref:Methylenetetrahydrofolate reductase n=1 Tax=Pseudopedobacter saltans TaxID=151895 RepID=A0A2W5F6W5_9SPHI|nr:MAG: methylenetetrahydrofolate reductase [NAD(P)H] [Pseudopedobacter saltans]
MKITEHIAKAKDTLLSYEILPPLKGKDIGSIYKHLDPLMEYKPSWINVTYHRTESVFKKRPDGSIEKTKMRKRPGTVGICAALENHYGVDATPHIICGGFSKNDTEDALIDLNFLGIDNILALRGDAAKSDGEFIPEPNGHRYAIDLIKQVANLNKGIYLEEDEVTDGIATNFCIGVAGYPEMHFEASNMKTDLAYLKAKVDAGAEYIMTQMFFDNQKFFDFVKNCRAMGINVPIIPGLKPITRKKQLSVLPKIFNVEIPRELSNAILQTENDMDAEKIGIEWLTQQSKALKAFGVPVLHYYTLGKPETIRNVVKEIF